MGCWVLGPRRHESPRGGHATRTASSRFRLQLGQNRRPRANAGSRSRCRGQTHASSPLFATPSARVRPVAGDSSSGQAPAGTRPRSTVPRRGSPPSEWRSDRHRRMRQLPGRASGTRNGSAPRVTRAHLTAAVEVRAANAVCLRRAVASRAERGVGGAARRVWRQARAPIRRRRPARRMSSVGARAFTFGPGRLLATSQLR